jgi:hypothetical protein
LASILHFIRSMSDQRLLVLLPALIAACGGNGAPADSPDPRMCSLTWKTLFSAPQNFLPPSGPDAVQLHGDQIFVNNIGALRPDQPAILALPAGGGDVHTVYQGQVWSFWFEDDNLLFNDSSVLYSMPILGGSPQPTLTYDFLNGATTGFIQTWALDRQNLYVALGQPAAATISIWRAARDGSGQQLVGTLPVDPTTSTFVSQLLPVGDHLVIETNGHLYTVPKLGTDIVEIAAPATTRSRPIALGADGTSLWYCQQGDYAHPSNDIIEVSPDGASQTTLWTTTLFDSIFSAAWSDDNGGWYVTAVETATDTGLHTTIWGLRAGVTATRLACDPEIQRSASAGIGSPDAVYLVATDFLSWQLAAVDAHR